MDGNESSEITVEERGPQRLVFLDVAKCLGIVLVVLGHLNLFFNRVIYSFHMPLFFLISGFFVTGKHSFKSFLAKKARALLVPYLFVGSLVLLLKPIILILTGGHGWNDYFSLFLNILLSALWGAGSNKCLIPFGIGAFGAPWFLLALFFSLLITKALIKTKFGFLVTIPLFVASYISSLYFWLPLSVQAAGCATFFVYFGALVRKHFPRLFDSMSGWKWVVFALGILFASLQAVFSLGLEISWCRFDFYGLTALSSVVICYSFIVFCKGLSSLKVIGSFLGKAGAYSIVFFCAHSLELLCVPWSTFVTFVMGQKEGLFHKALAYGSRFGIELVLIAVLSLVFVSIPGIKALFGVKKKPRDEIARNEGI